MRLLRYRFRSVWTAFIIIFSLAGVLLTYKRLTDSQGDGRRKHLLKDLVDGGDMNFAPVHHGIEKRPEVDEMEVQALQHNIERQQNKIKALPKIELPALDSDKYNRLRSLIRKLYPENWGTAPPADEMTMDVIEELNELGFESPMSCKSIDSLKISSSFRAGKKKFVDRAFVQDKGVEVIMKSQANDLDIKVKCLQSVYDNEKCSKMGNYVLLREIIWFSILKHNGIADLLGYCIRGDQIDNMVRKKGVIIMTEPGIPVMPSTFSMMKFRERLTYARQLSELLHYLEHHPLGSLALTNTYSADFIIVNNKLKLVDLDDLVFEEKKCQFNNDCKIPSAGQVKVTCDSSGRCENRNAMINLKKMGTLMFEELLNNAPPSYSSRMIKLRYNINGLRVTNNDVLQNLTDLEKSYNVPPEEPQQVMEIKKNVQQFVHQQRQQEGRDVVRQQEIEQNRILPDEKPIDKMNGDYERINQSNFPGKYDYPCQMSRVAWGCVITVRSLKEAKTTCNSDSKCQAFVLFSSQPDSEILMTMVLKNSRFGSPEKNIGATLFVFQPKYEVQPIVGNQQNVQAQDVIGQNNQVGEVKEESANQRPAPPYLGECKARIEKYAEESRKTRERRLMAHLGLKGYTEADWIQKMKWQKIVNHDGLSDFTAPSTIGGRFNVTMIGADKDNKLRNAIYMSEIGPSQYHVAYYIVYKLDRLLGLYHTPPSLVWFMTKNEVDIVRGDDSWLHRINMVAPNSEIKGVLTSHIPLVLKQEYLSIFKFTSLVSEVKEFTRQEKMQLEYIFLWFLTKIYHAKTPPFAYKGHMIQFSADGAFQDTNEPLTGYLYNCQFPNIVYKMMSCFKCHHTGKSTMSICGLGDEVLKQVEEGGLPLTDFKINQMTTKMIAQTIDDAASEVLGVVDKCIRSHTREKVLY